MYRKVNLEIPNLVNSYTIDTLGVVRNESIGKVLKGTSITRNNRYVKIHLDKFYPLHRLVAQHFLGTPSDSRMQVNHIDGNRNNNTVDNLEWVLPSGNVSHAFRTGLKKPQYGETCGTSKLTEAEVRAVWSLCKTNLTARQIRGKLNLKVSVDAIKKIRTRKNWTYLTDTLD